MSQLFSQLGIDWKLLLSQAVNFFLLLVVLRVFVYKPLLQLLHERRKRIEEGLMKADEADRRLREVDELGKMKVREAEVKAIGILKRTETDAKELESKMLAEAKRKEDEAMRSMDERLRTREKEAQAAVARDAAALVRRAMVRTVELAPEKVDDALIARAVKEVQ